MKIDIIVTSKIGIPIHNFISLYFPFIARVNKYLSTTYIYIFTNASIYMCIYRL